MNLERVVIPVLAVEVILVEVLPGIGLSTSGMRISVSVWYSTWSHFFTYVMIGSYPHNNNSLFLGSLCSLSTSVSLLTKNNNNIQISYLY